MTDSPAPELQELASRLFAAARAERPGPALGRRLALIPEPLVQRKARAPASEAAPRKFGAVAWRLGLGFAAAALLALSVTRWLSPRAITISAEQPSNRSIPSELPALPLRQLSVPQPAVQDRTAALRLDHAETAPPNTTDPARPSRTRAARSHGRKPRVTSAPSMPPRSPPPAPPGTALGAASTTAPSMASLPRSEPLSLRAELQLLESARSSLRAGDSQRALALLDQRAQIGSGHALDAEATLLRIEALSASGNQSAARDLAVRFVRDNPNSALSDRAKSFIHTPAADFPEPRGP